MIGVLRLTLTVVLPTVYGWAALAQDGFKLLGEKEIRARVIDKDITDRYHWSTYLRSDGSLFRDEMGRRRAGIWKIEKNKLCMSDRTSKSFTCNEVWMSGENIRLRAHEKEETYDAVIKKHESN
jgi:hypothetical protein